MADHDRVVRQAALVQVIEQAPHVVIYRRNAGQISLNAQSELSVVILLQKLQLRILRQFVHVTADLRHIVQIVISNRGKRDIFDGEITEPLFGNVKRNVRSNESNRHKKRFVKFAGKLSFGPVR